MQMIMLRRSHVGVALVLVLSMALLFSAVSLITSAQTILAATDVNLINIKAIYKTVWYLDPIPAQGFMVTALLSSWGRGRIHLMMHAEVGLTGSETMVFQLLAPLWNEDKTELIPFVIQEYTLTPTNRYGHADYDVPMSMFYFAVWGPAGRQASLSYYLSV